MEPGAPPRVWRSLLAGAATGALIVVAIPLMEMILSGAASGVAGLLAGQGVVLFAISFFVWLLGLVVFGLGPWLFLHRKGYRSWWVAVALGFSATSLLYLAFVSHGFGIFTLLDPVRGQVSDASGVMEINGWLTLHGWLVNAKIAAIVGCPGGAVAIVVWATSYRPWRKLQFDETTLNRMFN